MDSFALTQKSTNGEARFSKVPPGGGSGKDRKDLTSTEELILISLLGTELYGLQIIEAIKEASKGQRAPSVGNLYPTLRRLEQYGYVVSRMDENRGKDKRGGARRKFYSLTRPGMRKLAEMEELRERVSSYHPVPT